MLLLDTCTLLWLATGSERLSAGARAAMAEAGGRLHVSGITGLEVAQKHARRGIELPMEPGSWVARAVEFHGLLEIPVSLAIAAHSGCLPQLHRDPFDRIIVSTALLHGLTVITPDSTIAAYPGVSVRW